MEQVVPGRDNKLVVFLLLMMAYACQHRQAKHTLVFYNLKEAGLQFRNDSVYMNNTLFSGIAYQLYDNGDTLKVESYVDGVMNGYRYAFYENKILKEKAFYIDGKLNGALTNYYPNGNRRFLYHFKNNEFDGVLYEWYPDGKLFKKLHYKGGHENGMQQLWYEDGKVRANYEMKDGRTYGLIGVVGCTNIKASDITAISNLKKDTKN